MSPAELADRLTAKLAEFDSVAVALSGGVDSAVTAKAARVALGDRAVAATGVSPSLAERDRADAEAVAQQIGIRHVILETSEFADPRYVRNDGARCYFCKSELYGKMAGWRERLGVAVLCSGANRDDLGDYRPGLVAAEEHGVRHPLVEVGFGKAEVRLLAQHWGLANWDKPAAPCLSSRIAVGLEATPERVARIEAAEDFLRNLGFRDLRVRCHPGELARVEVPEGDLPRLLDGELRARIATKLTELGFQFASLDLTGLRSGSLNILVPTDLLTKRAPP
jgi:uncharacterized protein